MKYYATVDERTYEISIEGDGRITVDGAEIGIDMQRIGRLDLYSLLLDNASHEVLVEPEEDGKSLYGVMLEGTRYRVRIQDERSRRLALADRGLKPPAGEIAIKAPIPGLLVKLLVEPGQQVGEGETVAILEAMKMENDLRAPRAGTVHEVRVQPGTQVPLGQVILTIR